MSDPVELKVPGAQMGLARMGRMTALVVPNVVAAVLGDYILVDETADHVRVPVVVDRVSYTPVASLTTEDAQRSGFMRLPELEAALRKVNPHLDLVTLVTIFQWYPARAPQQ